MTASAEGFVVGTDTSRNVTPDYDASGEHSLYVYDYDVVPDSTLMGLASLPVTVTLDDFSTGIMTIIDSDDTLHDADTITLETPDADGVQQISQAVSVSQSYISEGQFVYSGANMVVNNLTTSESGRTYLLLAENGSGGLASSVALHLEIQYHWLGTNSRILQDPIYAEGEIAYANLLAPSVHFP